jgi:hypothetical protein
MINPRTFLFIISFSEKLIVFLDLDLIKWFFRNKTPLYSDELYFLTTEKIIELAISMIFSV